MLSDRDLVEEAMELLNDLRGAGVFRIEDLERHLHATFFMEEWESFIIIQEWVRIYYINARGGSHG